MATILLPLRASAGDFPGRFASSLQAFAEANQARIALWLPVLFGVGIGVFFVLPSDPPGWAAVIGAAPALPLLIRGRKTRGGGFILAVSCLAVVAGFAAAQLRTHIVSAPVLTDRIGPVEFNGRVVHVELDGKGGRILLGHPEIERLAPSETPARIRVTVRSLPEVPSAGDIVRAKAILQPPPEPSLPGGFDFARKAYFERIGGVGFVLGRIEIARTEIDRTGIDRAAGSSRWADRIDRFRQTATERIVAASNAAIGPVAAALMTGERRAISDEDLAAMRDSGLAHLLAISGLHIGLVAGLLFFGVRFALALVEPVALRYPIKKIAAVAAFLGALVYLLLSGATVPTQRAFLMTSIVLFAVLIDRTAISMRLVAIAAMVVLLIAPESLLGPSFQMSFAAVIALVAVYESAAPRLSAWRREGGISGGRVGAFLVATLLTSLVAGLATAPFAAYHFNRLALYGLVANMVAVPLMGLWIMPCAIAAFVLMPFGLEAIGLVPMGWGIGWVLDIARWTAGLPGAVALVPAFPTAALVLMAAGGLWLCLWRGRLRSAGLFGIAAGVAVAALAPRPDILVGREGDLVAVVGDSGEVALSPGRGDRFEREMWLRNLGASDAATWPEAGLAPAVGMACDAGGCIVRTKGRNVLIAEAQEAVVADCDRVDYAILLDRMSARSCGATPVLVDSFRLWRDGPHAVRLTQSGAVVENSRERRGDRPWSRISEQRRKYLRD